MASTGDRNLEFDEVLLDPAKMEEIKQLDPGGSAGLVQRIVGLFIDQTDEMLRRPLWTATPIDLNVVMRTAHSMKSTAGAVGARRLSSICASLERKLRSGESADVPRYFADMQSAYQETRKALGKSLAEEKA
jgi:hypothetical protein